MQILSLFFIWVATAGTSTAFAPTTTAARSCLPRQSCHCHATPTKSSSRAPKRAQTHSFAVTVESSASAAESEASSSAEISETTPYLDTPARTLTSLVPSLSHLSPAEMEDLMRKVINGIILTISFGSAMYAILNIDAGMTRGWTQSVSSSDSLREAEIWGKILVGCSSPVSYYLDFFFSVETILCNRKLPCGFLWIPGVVMKYLWKKSRL